MWDLLIFGEHHLSHIVLSHYHVFMEQGVRWQTCMGSEGEGTGTLVQEVVKMSLSSCTLLALDSFLFQII